jgi:hypothetical protein
MVNNSHQISRNENSSFSIRELRQVFNDWVRRLLPMGRDWKDSQRGKQKLESGNPGSPNSDAEFLGWQKTTTGEVFALYNVTAEQHPLYQSTVSENTLRKQHLEIPPTPLPQGKVRRAEYEM